MLARRLRAFELYSGGIKPIEIGRQLGVTRQTVSYWARMDKWDARLSEVIHRAEEALSHVLGDQIAHVLKSLRARMGQRVAELEGLCASRNEHVKLKAIQAWLKLAGIEQAVVNPLEPTSPRSLELIEDLVGGPLHDHEKTALVIAPLRAVAPGGADATVDRETDSPLVAPSGLPGADDLPRADVGPSLGDRP